MLDQHFQVLFGSLLLCVEDPKQKEQCKVHNSCVYEPGYDIFINLRSQGRTLGFVMLIFNQKTDHPGQNVVHGDCNGSHIVGHHKSEKSIQKTPIIREFL